MKKCYCIEITVWHDLFNRIVSPELKRVENLLNQHLGLHQYGTGIKDCKIHFHIHLPGEGGQKGTCTFFKYMKRLQLNIPFTYDIKERYTPNVLFELFLQAFCRVVSSLKGQSITGFNLVEYLFEIQLFSTEKKQKQWREMLPSSY